MAIRKLPVRRKVDIRGEFIALDKLLKFSAVVSTGVEAKQLIASGAVSMDGAPVTERGRKIRDGQTVRIAAKIDDAGEVVPATEHYIVISATPIADKPATPDPIRQAAKPVTPWSKPSKGKR